MAQPRTSRCGHALAALDSRWVFLAEKAVSGQEERLRRFARVLCALPAKDAPADLQAEPAPSRSASWCDSLNDSNQTFLEIANNSPYPIRLAAKLDLPPGRRIEDLGRGLRLAPPTQADGSNLVLDLLPYGVAAIRIAAPQVEDCVGDYLSFGSRDDRHAEPTSTSCRRSSRGSITGSPPARPSRPIPASSRAPAGSRRSGGPWSRSASAPNENESELAGWLVEGPMPGEGTIKVDRENPHSGQGSLKLSCARGPIVGRERIIRAQQSFEPHDRSVLPGVEPATKVRVWIEGDVRRASPTSAEPR